MQWTSKPAVQKFRTKHIFQSFSALQPIHCTLIKVWVHTKSCTPKLIPLIALVIDPPFILIDTILFKITKCDSIMEKTLILILLVVVEEDWKTIITEYRHLSTYTEVVFLKVKCKLNSVKVRTEYMVNSIHTRCFRRNLLYNTFETWWHTRRNQIWSFSEMDSPFRSAGCQFSSLLAVEECGSADSDCIDHVLMYSARLLATHSIRIFPLHFPSRVSPCAIRFRTRYT